MDDVPVIYGLEDYHARTLAAQAAETEKICFLVGTQSLRSVNQVQLIEIDDDTGVVTKHGYNHPLGEVWGLSAAPKSPDLISTVYYDTTDYKMDCNSSIFRLPSESMQEKGNGQIPLEVQKLCDVINKDDLKRDFKVHSTIWAPEDDGRVLCTVDNTIFLLDIEVASKSAAVVSEASIETKSTAHLGTARWCCHQQASQVSVPFGSDIMAWDLRTMKTAWTIPSAHAPLVRNLDFNANKQYYVASCGDDCSIKVWDIRQPTAPLVTRTDHSHWVWSVRFNISYDQLVLSCSSDQRVILSNLPSVGSKPLSVFEEEEKQNTEHKSLEDSILKTYDDHEDSVYAIEWSSADSWTFASLSYDGRLVVNKVPKTFKYKTFF